MRTSELTGARLDWAVAKCEGKRPSLFIFQQTGKPAPERNYSTDWAQGGPIIEREGISVYVCYESWWATPRNGPKLTHSGTTPLIAAMRCYVASKLGDEVEIPKELA